MVLYVIAIICGILLTAFFFCMWVSMNELPECLTKYDKKERYFLLAFLLITFCGSFSAIALDIRLKETETKVPGGSSTAPAEATAQQLTTSEIELRQYVLRCSETSNGICITYDIYRIVKE